MEKKLLSLAVAAAVAAPFSVMAEGNTFSGFIDLIHTFTYEASDGTGTSGDNPDESKLTAAGEVDFEGTLTEQVNVRVDVDLMTRMGAGGSAEVEQARFDWALSDGISVTGGLFNNPVGWEGPDAPDLYQTTSGLIFGILDGETAEYSNTLAGFALNADLGMFSGTLAFVNDIADADEENSIALVVAVKPLDNVVAEFGYLSQDMDTGTALGNLFDLNVTVTHDLGNVNLTGAVEILLPDEVVDTSYMLMGNAAFVDSGFGATVRLENISFDASGADDIDRTTLAGTYQATENLSFVLEWNNLDTGTDDFDSLTLEAIALF